MWTDEDESGHQDVLQVDFEDSELILQVGFTQRHKISAMGLFSAYKAKVFAKERLMKIFQP